MALPMIVIPNDTKVYTWGCLHFSHVNILRYANRPFPNVDTMNQTLLESLDSLPEHSVLIDLGDISFGGQITAYANYRRYFDKIISRKINQLYILKGNHDKLLTKFLEIERPLYQGLGLTINYSDYLDLSYKGQDFILSHYPVEDWNGKHKGSIHLHSHTHRELESSRGNRRFHVGVDTIGYTPVSLDAFIEKALKVPYGIIPHTPNVFLKG